MPELGTDSTYNPAHVCPYLQKMVGYNGVNPPGQEFVLGADDHGCDFKVFGATANHYIYFDETNDQFDFGQDDHGITVNFYGETSGAYLKWDEANDRLEVDGGQSELIRFVADGDGGVTVTNDGMTADPETGTEDAYLTVLVNATSYQIPLYSAT